MNNDDIFNSNPNNNPNRDGNLPPELEARVVAWVLGEASDFEAAELTRLCAEQPELAVFKRRIEAIHGLLGVAARQSAEPLRLSSERRAKVLAVIGGSDAERAATSQVKRRGDNGWMGWRAWALPVAACLALMLILAGVLIPTVGAVRETARRSVEFPDARQREQLAMLERAEHELGTFGDTQLEEPTASLASRSASSWDGVADTTVSFAMSPSPAPTAVTRPKRPDPSSTVLGVRMNSSLGDVSGTAQVSLDYKVENENLYAGPPVKLDTSGDELRFPSSYGQVASGVTITAGTPQDFTTGGLPAGSRLLSKREQAQLSQVQDYYFDGASYADGFSDADSPEVTTAPSGRSFSTSSSQLELPAMPNLPSMGAGAMSGLGAGTRRENNEWATGPSARPSPAKKKQTVTITAGVTQEFTVREPTADELKQDQRQRLAGVDYFAPPPPPAELVSRGRSLYIGGDMAAAEQTFRELQTANPDNPDAKYFLSRIAKDKATGGELAGQKNRADLLQEVATSWQRPGGYGKQNAESTAAKQLESTVIPSVNFKGLPLSQVLTSLASVSEEYDQTKGSEPLNFVFEGGAEKDPPVSVTLRNLSLKRIIDFVTTSVGYTYEIEGNTVRVRPELTSAAIPLSRSGLMKMLGASDVTGNEEAALKKFLQAAGIDWAEVRGSGLVYDGTSVIVKQTEKNIQRLQAIIRRYESQAEKEALDKDLRAETATADQAVSTFSLHVSDASFRIAQAALARGQLPDAATIRPEEFYNAFDYGDPAPVAGEPVACRIEQAAHPFLQQRNLVRIAMKVPAAGRSASQPLRLTVLLDTSGSMEREDRAATVRAALGSLASLLGPDDRVTLIGFARTPRLLAVDVTGDQAARLVEIAAQTPAEGGTNLEEALQLADAQARRMMLPAAQNRIVLLTDGAANLGNADPQQLASHIEALRHAGIAFDACGVVADGLEDGVLEALTRKGDGRYAVINSPEEADANFARQLAGAFRPAAKDVKVQVRFNPARVSAYRLIGFEQHRLKTEDFCNNKIDAAELAAEEAANALYQVAVIPDGEGELGEVFVRFLDPSSGQYVERSWTLAYDAQAPAFARATPSLQLAGSAAFLAEKLRGGELAGRVRLDEFAPVVNGLGAAYPGAARVREFIEMFRQTRRVTGE